jgi:hypothetical protein
VLTRFILWRLLALAATFVALAVTFWALAGGIGRLVRGQRARGSWDRVVHVAGAAADAAASALASSLAAVAALSLAAIVVVAMRTRARSRRSYVRWRVLAYRNDETSVEGIVAMFESLHQRLATRAWRRALLGQPSLALEVHRGAPPEPDGLLRAHEAWLAVSAPRAAEAAVEAALRAAYPNCSLAPISLALGTPPCLIRLQKAAQFIRRSKALDRYEHERSPAMNRLMTAMGTCRGPAYVQLALTPAPVWFERHAARVYRRHERSSRIRVGGPLAAPQRSLYDEVELKGGLWLQHRPLFFADVRVVANDRTDARQIASELCAQRAESRLVERHVRLGPHMLATFERRLARGEGGPLAPIRRGVFAATELAALWHVPSVDYNTVPFARAALPIAPAPPAVHRPREGHGLARDALGPVSIHEQSRRGNVAVPGAVEQGKTSLLVASIAEDLRRSRCAVIVLDPKGDAADAALSVVPRGRTCTLLDFSRPTCGFNPLAASAPPDVVADYVVAALRNLFTDADIRASSDRYLRNAVIAVLANDASATLWDAARLLSVGQEGYAYRARVGANVRGMPELKEISEFFTAELATQLSDARATTTSKLDAPVNKLARLLNSASLKRVLLNRSLRVDLDRVIAGGEVLIVKGALGTMGTGNTAVLMQMLLGMLDAALARQQDGVEPEKRVAVALKVDEAPLVVNRGFAETLALKRSAGLETVACWQTDSQWVEPYIRDQLDALFAHRVYFATASVRDARGSASLLMAEFSDSVRPGVRNLSALGRPDARLHLPKHHAIVSLLTPEGRQPPFLARTVPMRLDPERIAFHARRQADRGGRYLDDLRQPHWDDARDGDVEPQVLASADIVGAASSRATPEVPVSPATPDVRPGRASEAAVGVSRRETGSAGPPNGRSATIPPPSYRELVGVDAANRLRVLVPPAARAAISPDGLDLQILALVAAFRYVLSTEVHRRFNRGRALTTTQRRLRRLAEARLMSRLQFHRRDGAGTPMCYAITDVGLAALSRSGELSSKLDGQLHAPVLPRSGEDHRRVAQVRHELHVGGWVLALERALGHGPVLLRGADASQVSPWDGERLLGLREIRLPGGRTPHDFWRTLPSGERVEVERFETVRPDATVELPDGTDVLVEYDDRLPVGQRARKLERYDHLIAGWAMSTKRYGARLGRPPRAVFVCRDASRARECARRADAVLVASQAYAGRYPWEWEYPGRREILFAAERDVHAAVTRAYGVHPLPPAVRVAQAGEDPGARLAEPELRDLARTDGGVS